MIQMILRWSGLISILDIDGFTPILQSMVNFKIHDVFFLRNFSLFFVDWDPMGFLEVLHCSLKTKPHGRPKTCGFRSNESAAVLPALFVLSSTTVRSPLPIYVTFLSLDHRNRLVNRNNCCSLWVDERQDSSRPRYIWFPKLDKQALTAGGRGIHRWMGTVVKSLCLGECYKSKFVHLIPVFRVFFELLIGFSPWNRAKQRFSMN